MKKILTLLLALIICLNLALPALAEELVGDEAVQQTTVAEDDASQEEATDNDDEVTNAEAISIIIFDLEEEVTSTETPTNPVSAGLTPDSPLYFFDKLFENIQLALAKTPEAKAALLTAISQERLAEIEALDPVKLEQYVDALLSEVTAALQKAADAITEAQAKGAEVTKLMETLEQAAELGSSVELPEAIRKTEQLEETKSKLVETTRAVKVQAAVVKGIDEEVVVTLRSQGLGYGQIALLNKLAASVVNDAESETSGFDQVMAVFAANKSIGQTMKAFNTNPGQAKKQTVVPAPVPAADADEELADDETAILVVPKSPGNSGKAKENTPAKDKSK